MRVLPTATVAGAWQTDTSAITLTSPVTGGYAGTNTFTLQWSCSGATQYRPATVRNDNSTTAYLALSAEL
jgi:hypothetical protein